MQYDKTRIFNLTLVALLLSKRVTNADTDKSTEADNLRTMWDTAVESFLEECDLNETSTTVKLVLVAENPNDKWLYAYAYPSDCAFFRRIDSGRVRDTRNTQIFKVTGVYNGKKVIFTNKQDAYAEIITTDFLVGLSANSAQALAHKLGWYAAPLIVSSTDPTGLSKTLETRYNLFKSLAEQKDARENDNPQLLEEESDIAQARLE